MQNTNFYSRHCTDEQQAEWQRLNSFTKEYRSFIDDNLVNYKTYLQQSERIYIKK